MSKPTKENEAAPENGAITIDRATLRAIIGETVAAAMSGTQANKLNPNAIGANVDEMVASLRSHIDSRPLKPETYVLAEILCNSGECHYRIDAITNRVIDSIGYVNDPEAEREWFAEESAKDGFNAAEAARETPARREDRIHKTKGRFDHKKWTDGWKRALEVVGKTLPEAERRGLVRVIARDVPEEVARTSREHSKGPAFDPFAYAPPHGRPAAPTTTPEQGFPSHAQTPETTPAAPTTTPMPGGSMQLGGQAARYAAEAGGFDGLGGPSR
jgi:hypothetical protein